VAGDTDVNGDGLSDMLLGASYNDQGGLDAGKAYLILGRSAGDWGIDFHLTGADASFVGEDLMGQAGRRVSGAGDINADGYDDFLIGAPQTYRYNEEEGSAYLLFGRPSADWGLNFPLSQADIIYRGEGERFHAGFDVAPAYDINGDGIDDFLIGSWAGNNNGRQSGLSYIFFGSISPHPYYLEFDASPFSQQFLGAYYDLNGFQDITWLQLGEGRSPHFQKGTNVMYSVLDNDLFLRSFDGSAWLGPCTPGSDTTLDNGNVTLDCSSSYVTNDGRLQTQMRLQITCNRPFSCPRGNIYLRAQDQEGHDSDFILIDH
jgi:hypothetical protein